MSVHIVGRAKTGDVWTDRPTEARQGDGAELAVVIAATERRGKRRPRRVYIADQDLGEIRLRGRRIRKNQRRRWSSVGDVALRWSVVEPHSWRKEGKVAPNGTDTRFHSNVSLKPETYGKWLGYDEITYFETVVAPLSTAASARRRPANARPPRSEDDIYGGLGTMRYKVEVKFPDDRILSTAGAEAVDRHGIRPSVHRVSIRKDDTFVGYLTSYFMVPEVFGSAGVGRNHQTERFTGADCADVLTGAIRRAGYSKVWHTSVAGLPKLTRRVAGEVLMDDDGTLADTVTGVRIGDLIRIDYSGQLSSQAPRSWDHVGALYEDRSDPNGPHKGGPNGELDGHDLIIHMGHPHLVVEPLASQGQARLDVLRWNPRKLGRRR